MLVVSHILLLVAACNARDFVFTNNMDQTIWVGTQSNDGLPLISNGGWQMDPGTTVTQSVDDGWGGRFWGRTNCDFDNGGGCETGDCGNGLECAGNGGTPPTTLAEITLNGDQNNDFYDISLVNGFNVPMSFGPTDPANDGSYWCTVASCTANVNGECPADLQVTNGNGDVIACQATCDITQDPDACCSDDDHNSADTCSGGESAPYFESQCPDAYSYAYDDASSTFSCNGVNYNVIFG